MKLFSPTSTYENQSMVHQNQNWGEFSFVKLSMAPSINEQYFPCSGQKATQRQLLCVSCHWSARWIRAGSYAMGTERWQNLWSFPYERVPNSTTVAEHNIMNPKLKFYLAGKSLGWDKPLAGRKGVRAMDWMKKEVKGQDVRHGSEELLDSTQILCMSPWSSK